jgi:CheY-like chemotaxis protein
LPRCLIITPDREFAYVLSGIVSRHGLDVDIATDPFAALRALRVEPVDLLIYDVSSETIDHDMILSTLERDLPAVLLKTVVLTTTQFDSIRVPAGVPVIGRNDLAPLMRYLGLE